MSNGTTTWGPREYLAVTISILLGGLGAVGILQWTKSAPGDEPPIHVKGGSIDFNLVAKPDPNNSWYQDGTTWVPSGLRNGDKLGVFLLASTDCEEIHKVKSSVTFTYTDDTDPQHLKTYTFTLNTKAGNNGPKKGFKTVVDSGTSSLQQNASDPRKLSFGSPNVGYISDVTIDKSSCTFAKGEFQEAFVFEW